MKRTHEHMSSSRPGTVSEVREWLRRVELFEQVNWDVDMPPYGAVTHLLDDDFVWDWSLTCSAQYDAVAELTGVLHVNVSDRAVRHSQAPIDSAAASTPSPPGTVGRPPSVVPCGSDSADGDVSDCSSDDVECY